MTEDGFTTIRSVSESSVCIYFGDKISDHIHERVMAVNTAINLSRFTGFIETVPAYASLTIYFDPLTVMEQGALKGNSVSEKVISYLREINVSPIHTQKIIKPFLIPVCYEDEYGPDLKEVAQMSGLACTEIIRLHHEPIYKVFMLGFMPGFAYLGGINKKISMPRKKTPRKIVPAGSVGIAGDQTGIYPAESPGGWQLIGRTPMKMFDIADQPPAVLRAGMLVQFCTITRNEFIELSQ
jgi:inhibitor of KinA